jgi:hypothetical protein
VAVGQRSKAVALLILWCLNAYLVLSYFCCISINAVYSTVHLVDKNGSKSVLATVEVLGR